MNDYVSQVNVIVNGEARELPEGLTIADLVAQLGLNQRRIAIELNREIIMGEAYGARPLAEGDEVEIVHFVGGG